MRIFLRRTKGGRLIKIEAANKQDADAILGYLDHQSRVDKLVSKQEVVKVTYRAPSQTILEEWVLCRSISFCCYCGNQFMVESKHRWPGDQVVLCLACNTTFELPGIKLLPESEARYKFIYQSLSN